MGRSDPSDDCFAFTKPSNVLLLDEPTNFIDMATIEALEKLMQIYPGTILFTSHDSYFVERTADEVYEIKGQKIKSTYEKFLNVLR